jgi:exodeoxyribonuclease VII large subunit
VGGEFDAVAIIRGGGGDVGLSSFNNYKLSKEIALFPIPVITGIGHSTNETVAEMVAFKNAITPTELADFLIQKFHEFSFPLIKAEELIIERSQRILKDERLRLANALKYFQSVTINQLIKNDHHITGLTKALLQHTKFRIRGESRLCDSILYEIKKYTPLYLGSQQRRVFETVNDLEKGLHVHFTSLSNAIGALEKSVNMLDPVNILRRGFTITLKNGKSVKHYSEIHVGDSITTILADGSVVSNIEKVNKEQETS